MIIPELRAPAARPLPAFPRAVAPTLSRVPERLSPRDAVMRHLSPYELLCAHFPAPLCTLGDIRAKPKMGAPPQRGRKRIYVVSDPLAMAVVYCGLSNDPIDRINRHIREWRRHNRLFARILHQHRQAAAWHLSVVSPDACIPLIDAQMRAICAALDTLGMMPDGYSDRVTEVLSRHDLWATPHFIEAVMIGILAPYANVAGNRFGTTLARNRAVPDQMLDWFVRTAEQKVRAAERKRANALIPRRRGLLDGVSDE